MRRNDRNQSMKAGRDGSLIFLGRQTTADVSRLNQTRPDPASTDRSRRQHSKRNRSEQERTSLTKTEHVYRPCYRGNGHITRVRSAWVTPGPIVSPVLLLWRSEGGPVESWEMKKLYSKTPPICHQPSPAGVLLVAYVNCKTKNKSKTKASPSPVGQHSLRQKRLFHPNGQF